MSHSGTFRLLLAISVAAVVAAACTPRLPGLSSSGRELSLPCPNVTLLDDTDELTKFQPGPGRDLTDIEFEAEIAQFTGECQVTSNREGGADVAMEMVINFRLSRGPALRSGVAAFPYFVAIVDDQERIMTKEIFDVAVRFDGQRAISATDRAVQRMNLPAGVSPAQYVVIVGFQLDGEQLRFNRDR